MNDELDQLRTAWAAQTVEVPRYTPEELHAAARRFDRTLRWRNLREQLAGVLVIVGFSWTAYVATDPFARLGAVLLVAGAISVMVTLARRGAPRPLPAAIARDCVAWRREELERQRDLLATVWRWYLGPLVPGLAVFLLPALRRADGWLDVAVIGGTGLVAVLVFVGIGRLNRAAAQALQAELDALEEGR